ncbi:MAG: hypothetical protein K2J04_11815 [Lachnospiraceae bacterium]|nr:hypothetical protein [Lachnospiraceae bacterium]
MLKGKTRYGLLNSLILAGVILLFMGLYYGMIKAGIPYQDPTLEMQIQYTIDLRIGEILMGNGFLIVVCGGFIRLIFKVIELIRKKHQRK